jgi:predicted small metal-binding protein
VSARAARATGRALLRHPDDALARDDAGRPTIIVFGEHDIFGRGSEIVLDRFPSAEQYVLGDCGRVPWIQAPDRFADIVRRFYGAPPRSRREI